MKIPRLIGLILTGILLLSACDGLASVEPTSIPSATRAGTLDAATTTVTTAPDSTSSPTPAFTHTPLVTAAPMRQYTSTPWPTNTQDAAASATPTRTATPTAQVKVVQCPGAPDTQLKLDDWAMVSIDPPLPNRVRSQPGSDGEVTGMIQPGETVLIEDGPHCADGYTWWYVVSLGGLEGWTAEGDAESYWLVPLQPLADWGTEENTVTLVSGQVRSAVNIEAAIHEATARGTRPGTVILDGANGAFVFSGEDTSINIFVSNLALVGVRGAKIEKCGDGLFFDNFPLKNIRVEGIEFVCEGHGIYTSSAFDTVILRNNIFRTGLSAIIMGGASSNWSITNNLIESEQAAIEITAGKKFTLANNLITGNTGIIMRQCYDFLVLDNSIQAKDVGIQLIQKAARNQVQMNTIQGVSFAGITLETGVIDNQIIENSVTCAPGTSCKTVESSPAAAEANTISGNLP